MRQQTNKHILELDLSNPIPVESNGIYQDTVNYPRLVIEDEQSYFDKMLRDKLIAQQELDIYGNPIKDDTWIDVDAYDPSFFSLDMFSPDELLNNSSEYVFYYGYDIYGNKLSTVPTLKEFFEGVMMLQVKKQEKLHHSNQSTLLDTYKINLPLKILFLMLVYELIVMMQIKKS